MALSRLKLTSSLTISISRDFSVTLPNQSDTVLILASVEKFDVIPSLVIAPVFSKEILSVYTPVTLLYSPS